MSRIAFVITNKSEFNVSHYNNQEVGKAKDFVRLGHDVDIFVYSKRAKGRMEVFAQNGHSATIVYYSGLPLPGRQTFPLNLKRKLARHRYDFAHVHEYPWIPPIIAGRFLRKRGTKVILVQGMYEDFATAPKRIYNRVYDLLLFGSLLRAIDGIIFKTTASRRYLNDKGAAGTPSTVIPVGLDTELLASSPGALEIPPETCRAIDELGERRLLYVGVLEPRRRPDFLVRVLSELVARDPEYSLIVVGDGPEREKLRASLEAAGLERHVVLIPSVRQQDLSFVYARGRLLLLPSRYEIFGMVLLEALHAGLATLSTPTAGATDIMGSQTVSFVRDLDLQAWVETIVDYFQKGRFDHRGNTEYVEAELTWRVLVPRYLAFFGTLSAPPDVRPKDGSASGDREETRHDGGAPGPGRVPTRISRR